MDYEVEVALETLSRVGLTEGVLKAARKQIETRGATFPIHPSAYEEIKWDELIVRVQTCLQLHRIRTHGLLQIMTEDELEDIRNLGQKRNG